MENHETEYKEVETKVWKHEKEGDQIEGVLVAKTPKEGEMSARYKVDTKDGIMLVWGSAILDDRLETVEVGQKVRITFKEKKPIEGTKKTLNIFKVEVAQKKQIKEEKVA